jgi:hypothetical protein
VLAQPVNHNRAPDYGEAGRNVIKNLGRLNTDIALNRYFNTWHNSRLVVRAEIFNLFNHPQYRIYDPEKGNPPSDTITGCGGTEEPPLVYALGLNTQSASAPVVPSFSWITCALLNAR